MRQFKSFLANPLSVLVLYLITILTILAINEMSPVWANSTNRTIVVTNDDRVQYLSLTDAPPQRDIAKQRFAPLEVIP